MTTDHAAALAEADGTPESLALTAQMLERYGPQCFPANENGQVHFARVLIESAAQEIRAYLAAYHASKEKG